MANNKELITAGSLEALLKGYLIYSDSIISKDDSLFLIARDKKIKYLFIISDQGILDRFQGEILECSGLDQEGSKLKKCPLIWENLTELRQILPHLNPSVCKGKASFGAGDRLGIVTSAHIEGFGKRDIFPVLAQQSVRELDRTGRNWKDVMGSAIWGYVESGKKVAFGSDADHVKEENDLKSAADAGFTMFTVDPSDHIMDLSVLSRSDISSKYNGLDNKVSLENKYVDRIITLGNENIQIDKDRFVPIVVKYTNAIERVVSLYGFLKDYLKRPFDFEVSMDEIEEPVTSLEHYFISSELTSAGIKFNNLALRYPGRWEKAVDYMGDLDVFERQLAGHAQISNMFEGYKLSLHSGSEKFSTYKAFSRLNNGTFHIKTAGTSYLEALRVIAETDYDLFRQIFTYSFECFEEDRDSYHLTTDTSRLKGIDGMSDSRLKDYLDMRESRQVLHVTFGSILTAQMGFREKIYRKLFEDEKLHYRYVKENIDRHLDLLV